MRPRQCQCGEVTGALRNNLEMTNICDMFSPGWLHQLHCPAAVGDLGRAGPPRHQPHPGHPENKQVRVI